LASKIHSRVESGKWEGVEGQQILFIILIIIREKTAYPEDPPRGQRITGHRGTVPDDFSLSI
jgi:hypothetical protein